LLFGIPTPNPHCRLSEGRLVKVFAQAVTEEVTLSRPGGSVRTDGVRARCQEYADQFVARRCAEYFGGTEEASAAKDFLTVYVHGGKFLRSAFAVTGWSCGREVDAAAVRAAASLELLHCFALAQDDVMDGSAVRRGRPALHQRWAHWHRERGLSGSATRFGESAAVLMGDLYLVWAEQMFRDSGLDAETLARGWPHYDAMRTELAAGQLSDLVNDAQLEPRWDAVLDVARRKSGNYTVRRPLELGAALAGCPAAVSKSLGRYGLLVGEAFQLRDDVLGVFGHSARTGKPVGEDLRDRKATSITVLARDLASPAQLRELRALAKQDTLDDTAITTWQELIVGTGALDRIEDMILDRTTAAVDVAERAPIPGPARDSLVELAGECTRRDR
jgi:geranylgeranyl diphosphate synthase, type I